MVTTLPRVQSRKGGGKGAAGYEKKFLHLAIIKVARGDTEDVAQSSHGSVVINLADFSAMQQGPKKLAFRVSVTKEVTGALARIGKTETPTLIITPTCAPAPAPAYTPATFVNAAYLQPCV